MPTPETMAAVHDLLGAVRSRPTELPLESMVALARQPVVVTMERSGPEPVAFVETRPGHRFDHLSPREREVATLVAAGFSNRQIADTLFISLATVKDHVHAILLKSHCESRSAVAASWYGT